MKTVHSSRSHTKPCLKKGPQANKRKYNKGHAASLSVKKKRTSTMEEPKRKKPESVDLCREYDILQPKLQLFQEATPEELLASLIASTGLTFARETKSHNRSTAVYIFFFSNSFGVPPHELFNNKLNGYFIKKSGKTFCGFSLEPVNKQDLEPHIGKMQQYNLALSEERLRVVTNVLSDSPSPQPKSIATLSRDAWDMLISSSTIYHCLRYALDCINTRTSIPFRTSFKFGIQMTEDCHSIDQYRNRAINLILVLSKSVGTDDHILDQELSKMLQDQKSSPKQFATLVDQLGQDLQVQEVDLLASHYKVLQDFVATFKENVTGRTLSKMALTHGGKEKGKYFDLWLPVLAVGFYTTVIFPRNGKAISQLKLDLKDIICPGSSKKPKAKPKPNGHSSKDSKKGPPSGGKPKQSNKPLTSKDLSSGVTKPQSAAQSEPKSDRTLESESDSCSSSSSEDQSTGVLEEDAEFENQVPFDVQYRVPTGDEWKDYKTKFHMECWLHIQNPYFNIKLDLSMQETYCTSKFSKYRHGRRVKCGTTNYNPTSATATKGFFLIPEYAPVTISGEIQVSQAMSRVWRSMASIPSWNPLFPTNDPSLPNVDLSLLINGAIFMHRQKSKNYNQKRSTEALQIPFGLVNRMRQWCGFELLESCRELNCKQKTMFITDLGCLCENIFAHMQRFQEMAGKKPLCPNLNRDQRYAANFRKKLRLPRESKMGKEAAFVTFQPIGPNLMPHNHDHTDRLNPSEEGYHETGCHSQVVTSNGIDMYLFQVIIASRNWISIDCKNGIHLYNPVVWDDDEDDEDDPIEACNENVGDQHGHGYSDADREYSEGDEVDTDQDDGDQEEVETDEYTGEDEQEGPMEEYCSLGDQFQAYSKQCLEGGLALHQCHEKDGDLINFCCPYVPVDLLVPLVQLYHSEVYHGHFEDKRTAVQPYSSTSLGRRKTAFPHAEYLMCGPGNLHKHEINLMNAIRAALGSRLVGDSWYIDCGCIWTVNGMYHQPSHINHRKALKPGHQAFIGHMGLTPEGSLLRLGFLSKEATDHIGQGTNVPSKVQVVEGVLFLHIPFGSLLLIDARQFHGGHYGSDNQKRFHCILSNFQWVENNDADELCLLSQRLESGNIKAPKTGLDDIEHEMKECVEAQNQSRKDYIAAYLLARSQHRSDDGTVI
ncbi:unnamed protein product [Cylindrotheca closterium]|uniref:Uncharacterized protein n=1 Tax=Cylindrotheca closterium TaxID=2856 RepID=A0AAD2CG18_9STRA|nr:unnamed protein product [Cylindrotheca closterium]